MVWLGPKAIFGAVVVYGAAKAKSRVDNRRHVLVEINPGRGAVGNGRVARLRQREGVARAIYPRPRQRDALADFVNAYHRNIVAAVVARKKFFAKIQLGKLPLRPRQRVANPARKPTRFLLEQHLPAVAPAAPTGNVFVPTNLVGSFGAVEQQKTGPFFVIHDVVHGFVVAFYRQSQATLVKIFGNTQRHLARLLRGKFGRAGYPQVGWEANTRV